MAVEQGSFSPHTHEPDWFFLLIEGLLEPPTGLRRPEPPSGSSLLRLGQNLGQIEFCGSGVRATAPNTFPEARPSLCHRRSTSPILTIPSSHIPLIPSDPSLLNCLHLAESGTDWAMWLQDRGHFPLTPPTEIEPSLHVTKSWFVWA